MTLTDSHCHLDLLPSVAGALAVAASVGVSRVITIGVDLRSSRWAAELAGCTPGVSAAVAVHPNESGAVTPQVLAELERLAGQPQVRAVGETGLDHFRTPPEQFAQQEEAFRAHIGIAKRTDRALVIHDRDSHSDVLRVLAAEGPPERVVFHCFSGDAAFARTCVDAGYVLSFAGTVTFRNAADLREAAALVPAGQLLVETDAPFLAPHPHRGTVNGPEQVALTVRTLAEVSGRDLAEVCADIQATTDRVFGAVTAQ